MVCDRCKKVLERELEGSGFHVSSIELGEIHFLDNVIDRSEEIHRILKKNGFEWVEEAKEKVINSIKNNLITALENDSMNQNLSEYLTTKMNRDYSVLSKLFSANEGITIEKYFIRLKIEKVKEFIQMGDKTFSEIAYRLGYAGSSHLARQFKSITGMSMTEYLKTQEWNRKPLDKII